MLQHQHRLKAFLMSREGFGMSGPFSVPFSSVNGSGPSRGTGEKLLLFCDVAVIRKKKKIIKKIGTLCRTFPQGPPDCNILAGPWITMRCRAGSRGLLGSECCQLYSNTLSRFHVWPYKCVSRLLIFHHIVLHCINLMQHLVGVHVVTGYFFFSPHSPVWAYLWWLESKMQYLCKWRCGGKCV